MELLDGQNLISIFWPGDDAPEISVGKGGCLSLVIYMEPGQMAYVPWVIATYEDGKEYRYNLALTEGVRTR